MNVKHLRRTKLLKPTFAIAASLVLVAAPALAQSSDGASASGDVASEGNWSGFIGAGPGVAPEFEGASQKELIPFIFAELRFRDVTLEVRGLGARLDVLGAFGNTSLYGGPAVRVRLPRDNKVEGPVARLNEITTQVSAGGYLGYRVGGDDTGRGRVSFEVTGLTSSKGFEGTGAISYAAVRSERFFVDFGVNSTYANAKYMRTYFGVTAAESVRSGLAAFRPGGGIKDVGSDLTIGFNLSRRWSLVANSSYNYLLGDAADSPIVKGVSPLVKGKGSRNQFVGGVGIVFRF
jgi:MipA family protein